MQKKQKKQWSEVVVMITARPEGRSVQVRIMKSRPALLCLCLNHVCPLSAFTGSPHYSEDFEDDEDVKVPLEEVCAQIC